MTRRLVLAGLGHAHLFVLEALARGRLGAANVLVCSGEAQHVYSGMVPGWLAGRYRTEDMALDTAALCARAGATWQPQHVTGLDASSRTVTLANGDVLAFDVCSVAVGSQPAALETPGARAHAFALKPLARVHDMRARVDALADAGGGPVVFVGAGLAALELAFATRARARQRGGTAANMPITVVGVEHALVPARAPAFAARLTKACVRHDITLQLGQRVTAVDEHAVQLASGASLPSACTVWATGAAAPAWLAGSGLSVDARGFLLVNERLQVLGADDIFAAGDCATPAAWAATPKAGVYAVRMGPVLASSLAHALRARPRTTRTSSARYVPQRRFLAIADTADGRAVANRGAFVAEGRWVRWWKDRLDQGFMRRFRPSS